MYLQSNSEIRSGARPGLAGTVGNMEGYDLTGKLIIPFCTSGGSDIDETMPTFLDSCDGLAVYGQRRISQAGEIDSWLRELDLGLSQ